MSDRASGTIYPSIFSLYSGSVSHRPGRRYDRNERLPRTAKIPPLHDTSFLR